MAQVFWVPKVADEGSPASDITYTTPWYSIVGTEVVDDVTDGRHLEITYTSTSSSLRRCLRISEIAGLDVDSDNDVEIYCRYKISGSSNDHYLFGRVSGSTSSEEAVWARMSRTSGWTTGYYDAGAATGLGSDAVTDDLSFRVRKIRLRINGTDVKAKFWYDGDSEPGSWTFEDTQSAVTTGGGIAIGRFSSAGSFYSNRIFEIGVGTGGDTAPTSSAAGGGIRNPLGGPLALRNPMGRM